MKAITKTTQEALPVVATASDQVTGFLSIIERAAMNPSIDVHKMEKLLDMQERIINKQSEIAFSQAMARLQPLLPVITHKSEIKHDKKLISTYAKYEDIDPLIRPHYSAEGFSLSFNTKQADGKTVIYGTLSHMEGHSRTAEMTLPLDTSGAKNSIQAMGSTISYGKRYLVGMLLNIVTKGEDDDGAGANDFLAPEMVAEVTRLIEESKSDKEKFLKFMKSKDVASIRLNDYQKALNALKAKAKSNQKVEGNPNNVGA